MNQIHKKVLVQIGAQKFSSLNISGVGARDLPCLTRSYNFPLFLEPPSGVRNLAGLRMRRPRLVNLTLSL